MPEVALCFGGSFNPIHNGHLECCRIVAHSRGFSRVLLIPSSIPPHKPRHYDMADSRHRLSMCRLAVEGDPLFEVSDIELLRGGPSYTYDTIQALKQAGCPRISWLIGADMLMILPNWYRAAELLDEADILVMARPGTNLNWQLLPPPFRRLAANLVPAPLIDISATEIRRRIRAGLDISQLVPKQVAEYIQSHGIYR